MGPSMMDKSARQALMLLARREARANGQRSLVVALIIAAPVMLVAAGVVLFGSSFENEPWAPLFFSVALDPLGLVLWVFIVGLLFLVSLAAFAVGDRQSERTYRLLITAGAESAHIKRLAIHRSLIPGTVGVALGTSIGIALGLIVARLRGNSLEGLHWITIPLGLVTPVLLTWLGVLLGAWWPTRSRRSDPDRRAAPSATDPTRTGSTMVAASLVALTLGSASYNNLDPGWPAVPETLALTLLTVAPLVLIAGLVLLLPAVLKAISSRLDGGPGWLRFGFTDLARNRGRAGLAAGVTLGLSVLAVMAAAGIQSDQDLYVELDERYVVSEASGASVTDAIEDALGDTTHERIQLDVVAIQAGISPQDRNRIQQWRQLRAAIVDNDLADALGLSSDDRRALAAGVVLVNSGSDLFGRTTIGLGELDELPTLRVDHGEGSDTPLALLVGPDLVSEAGIDNHDALVAYIAEAPLNGSTRDDILDVARANGVDIAIAGIDPFDSIDFTSLVTIVMAALAVSNGTLTAVLALRADHQTLDVVDDLGAGPRRRRLMAATQVGLQQLVAGLIGAAVGVGLFRIVTLGDPSVPDWILPWATMAIMAVVVPLVTAVLTGLWAPGRRRSGPTRSSRAEPSPVSIDGY